MYARTGMEKETGCKIAIRGRGSVKSGRGGRRDGRVDPDENDDLHVVVTGRDEAMVDKAADMVERLLRPVDDSMNEHKQARSLPMCTLHAAYVRTLQAHMARSLPICATSRSDDASKRGAWLPKCACPREQPGVVLSSRE